MTKNHNDRPQPLHFVRWDEPSAKQRLARSVCGVLVNPQTETSPKPTCPDCAKWVREFDALEVGDAASV